MKINTNSKTKNLVVTIEIDPTPLQEKLKLLSEFKSSFLENSVNNIALKSSFLLFEQGINYSNILFCDDEIAIRTTDTNKLLSVIDFDIVNFFRKWFIAMRAANINVSFHDNSLICRGN